MNMNETPIEIKNFETLYGYDSKNKQKQWCIMVEKHKDYSIMKYSYGYVDGKQTECSNIISKGKNIGKINETTHFEQAILEAKSKWTKKRDEGYNTKENKGDFDDIKQITNSFNEIKIENTNEIKEQIVFPMLAHDYHKYKNKLKFPVYIQPKLDGYRLIFNSKDGSCNSRQGKEFTVIKQTELYKELNKISQHIILDGELYIHGGVFEKLGILRKKTLNNEDKEYLNKIEYHVYDIVIENTNFETRLNMLKNLIKDYNFTKIKLVDTYEIKDETELKEYHKKFVQNNYEGSILRNKFGMYRKKIRSMDLLKYKDFEDDEFEIVDYTYEIDTSDKNDNLIVWICKTKQGDQFNVRPGGTKEERQMLYKNCKDNFIYKKKKLHVKYFELTDKGVPRFPTTKTTSVETYIREIVE